MTFPHTAAGSLAARMVRVSGTAIALLFTGGWIVHQRPEPFYALLSGTGFGALGAGIIAIALAWVKRIEPLAGIGDTHDDAGGHPS